MKRWIPVASVVLALGVVAATAALSVAWTIRDPGLRASIIAHLVSSSGLSIVATGPMRLRLLPTPSIEMQDVSMTGLDGEVTVDADGLTGRLGLPGLVKGRLDVVTATVDGPTIVVDLDRLGPLAAAVIDASSALRSDPGKPAGGREPLRFLRTDGLTVRGGVLRLTSKDPQRDTILTDIVATVGWPSGPGEGSIDGRATWRGTPATFTAVLDAPGDLLGGGASDGSLRVRSPVIDLSASGSIGLDGGFHGTGKLSASTNDLRGFLKLAGTPLPQLDAFRTASLDGQATLAPDTLSLSDVNLSLDDLSFEGALVVHDAAGRPGLAGTLDTERIDLNPFLTALPALRAPDGSFSDVPFDVRSVADDDIDLRISASKARIGPLEVEDGSLSLQSGNGRMELSLGEARAYDGLLKGRIVATIDNEDTDVRADFSLSRLDLTALAKDAPSTNGLAGTATGHLMLEGRGRSYGALLRGLEGRGQASVRNGAVGGRLATALMPESADGPAAAMTILNRLGTFDSASADFDVARGVATFRQGSILWPDAMAALKGSASIPLGSLDVTAELAATPDRAGAPAQHPAVFALTGPWSSLRLAALDARHSPFGGGER